MAEPIAASLDMPFPLAPLEIATSLVYGNLPTQRLPHRSRSMREALESVVLDALVAGRTLVSFSGGRDSSAVLAVAASVARREGLPPPIPLTITVPGSPAADEAAWQDLVLDALRITERHVLPVTDELGLLGPIARSVLRRHGVLFPANAYVHDLMLAESRGATLLTGAAGDELFDDSTAAAAVLAWSGLAPLTFRDVARTTASLLAAPAYRRRVARFVPGLPWLSRGGNQRHRLAMARDQPAPYRGWSHSVAALAAARSFHALSAGQAALARDHGASVVHPFMTVEFLGAAAASGGRIGLGGRTAAMHALVGDLLPAAVIERPTKAHFGAALWTGETLTIARHHDSIEALGACPALAAVIDPGALREQWASPRPHYLTASLLHAAAILTGRHRIE